MQGTEYNRGMAGDHMSLNGFSVCIKMDIGRKLGNRFKVEVKDITKNNDTKLKGLVIMEQGSNIHPTIYMENFYECYKAGVTIEEIVDRVLQVYQEGRTGKQFDMSLFTDWSKVQRRITYRLVNLDRNRELLKDVPHRKILDLAIVPEYFLRMDGAEGASVLIHNSHMGLWGITAEELFTTAFKNTPELMGYTLASMEEVMLEILGSGEVGLEEISDLPGMEELCGDTLPMYVLTNRYRLHGAGCIIYKDLLKGIAEKWDCDICIIPSSIHETILIPMDRAGNLEELSLMVKEINQTQVTPDEVLSDNVYQFVRKTGKLIMQEEMP